MINFLLYNSGSNRARNFKSILKLLARLLPELYSTRSNYYYLFPAASLNSYRNKWQSRHPSISQNRPILLDSPTMLFYLIYFAFTSYENNKKPEACTLAFNSSPLAEQLWLDLVNTLTILCAGPDFGNPRGSKDME